MTQIVHPCYELKCDPREVQARKKFFHNYYTDGFDLVSNHSSCFCGCIYKWAEIVDMVCEYFGTNCTLFFLI